MLAVALVLLVEAFELIKRQPTTDNPLNTITTTTSLDHMSQSRWRGRLVVVHQLLRIDHRRPFLLFDGPSELKLLE